MVEANLVVSRAAAHIAVYPQAAATPLVRDMKNALSALIEEVQRK